MNTTVNTAEISQPTETVDSTLEVKSLIMHLKLLVNLRWIAIAGIVLVTLGAKYVFLINFPALPIYIICVFIGIYNLALIQQIKELVRIPDTPVLSRGKRILYLQIFLDMVALIVLIHFSGGIENPFIFFFIFHIILASIELKSKSVYLLSTVATVLVVLLVTLEYTEVIPHVNLEGFVLPIRYQDTSRVLAVVVTLTSLLFGTSFIITSVVGELNKRQRHLEEQRSRFLRFIGIAAHDLKAPLGAIQGFLWVILGGFAGEVSEKHRNLLERSSRRINELLTLISDLLDIPRIENGQIVYEIKAVSLNQIINNCIETQAVLAKEKDVELKILVDDGLPDIYGSTTRLQQALTNLINNAIKYTPENGIITLRVEEKGKYLQVEIVDTGIGIPPDDLPHIFDDFYRAKNADSKGTGLGLSITKRIIEAHGGKIRVESFCSETNTGSKFSFNLLKARKT